MRVSPGDLRVLLLVLAWALSIEVRADENAKTVRSEAGGQNRRDDIEETAIQKDMREQMETVKVSVAAGRDQETEAVLYPKPVFRYTDVPRRIFDGTLWVWTVDGRPVAMQKLEACSFRSRSTPLERDKTWTHCFTSLSTALVKSRWPENAYESTAPGVNYKAIPKAPAPDVNGVRRKLQIRQLSRRFSAVSGRTDAQMIPMRMMPRPIFEFSAPDGTPAGAIFGLEANGTNPDMLIIISAMPDADGQLSWQFGVARMTDTGAKILLDDVEVHSSPTVPVYNKNEFENWTFFYKTRTLATPEESETD